MEKRQIVNPGSTNPTSLKEVDSHRKNQSPVCIVKMLNEQKCKLNMLNEGVTFLSLLRNVKDK